VGGRRLGNNLAIEKGTFRSVEFFQHLSAANTVATVASTSCHCSKWLDQWVILEMLVYPPVPVFYYLGLEELSIID